MTPPAKVQLVAPWEFYKLFIQHDPLQLMVGLSNVDEYVHECNLIWATLVKVAKRKSKRRIHLGNLVHKIFVKQFGLKEITENELAPLSESISLYYAYHDFKPSGS